MNPPRVVAVDTETTRLNEPTAPTDPNTVWEVAAVTELPSHGLQQWCWQLRVDPANLDPQAAHVNGFHTRYLLNRPEHAGTAVLVTAAPDGYPPPGSTSTLQQWAAEFTALLAGNLWVGIGPDFDTAHLRPLLTRAAQHVTRADHPWHYQIIDARAMAAGLLGAPAPWHTDTLMRTLNIRPPAHHRHTALGDATAAHRLYTAVLAERRLQAARP